jgi:hypothetical protein
MEATAEMPAYLRYMKPLAREILMQYDAMTATEVSMRAAEYKVKLEPLERAVNEAVRELTAIFVVKLQAGLARLCVHTGDMRQMLDDLGYD